MYLPVEVKIDITLESDLVVQLTKYINVVKVTLDKNTEIGGKSLFPYVLVIDTNSVYIFDGEEIKDIIQLDAIQYIRNIKILKEFIINTLENAIN